MLPTDLRSFKAGLGRYLEQYPDTPPVAGYTAANDNTLLSWEQKRTHPMQLSGDRPSQTLNSAKRTKNKTYERIWRAMCVSNFFEIQAQRLKCVIWALSARARRLSTHNWSPHLARGTLTRVILNVDLACLTLCPISKRGRAVRLLRSRAGRPGGLPLRGSAAGPDNVRQDLAREKRYRFESRAGQVRHITCPTL